MTDRSLDGVRVVEFTDAIGSYCGRLLADLGAEVIKVEPPAGGQERHTPPFFRGDESPDTSIAFWVHNTSKKSVVLDLETAEGRAQAKKLALTADIILEDNPPGWMAERGLGFEQLHAEKPALVYTAMSGFGETGPHAGYAYSDIVGQAMGGLMTLAGDPEDQPNTIYGQQANASTSIQAAQGTLIALLSAEATGEGQLIDVSAQESVLMSEETAMQGWDLQKKNRVRSGERGSLAIQIPGLGNYATSDGHIFCFVVAPAGKDWPDLLDWMREKGLAGDLDEEPYASISSQLNMRFLTQVSANPAAAAEVLPALPHINEVLTAFFASMTSREAYEEGQARKLLIGIVSTPKDLAENTQLRARNWFVDLDLGPLNTKVEFPGPPYRLSETPAIINHPPALGEHTVEILASLS